MSPPVVAVPGTLGTPLMFGPLARELAGRVRVAAYDWMTGPGPWDIPAVADRLLATVRHRTGGTPVVLAGHSTGGAIALQAAVRSAERDGGTSRGGAASNRAESAGPSGGGLIAGLLIINSGANTAGHGDIDALLDVFRASKYRGWRAVGGNRSFATPPPAALRLRMAAYALLRVPAAAVLDVLSSQRDLDLAPRLAEITCPVTVLHGVLDQARTPEHARTIAEEVAAGEVRWARTGHTPPVEDPQATADAVVSLLSRL